MSRSQVYWNVLRTSTDPIRFIHIQKADSSIDKGGTKVWPKHSKKTVTYARKSNKIFLVHYNLQHMKIERNLGVEV